jgi:hypothetical protein
MVCTMRMQEHGMNRAVVQLAALWLGNAADGAAGKHDIVVAKIRAHRALATTALAQGYIEEGYDHLLEAKTTLQEHNVLSGISTPLQRLPTDRRELLPRESVEEPHTLTMRSRSAGAK